MLSRNKRTVWEVSPEAYPEAHFAVFPQALVEPCVLAGTSERGVCAECRAPWERVIERSSVTPKDYEGKHLGTDKNARGRRILGNVRARREAGGDHDNPFPTPETTGWRPTCDHEADTVPATVLDLFAGSGTVGLVAQKLGRQAVGIDASESYLAMARRRIEAVPLPMALEL